MDHKDNQRASWGSSFGFIMAAAGSAVGLGNLWKFPYLAGQHGGGIFVFTYLLIIVLIGFTMMLGEMVIGRRTKLDAFSSFNKLRPGWGWIGGVGIAASFLILSFYSVVGGWVLKYIVASAIGSIPADSGGYFGAFISAPVEPLVYHAIFMIATVLIVVRGISGGIEKASKFLMPALIVLLILVVLRSVTLPGAGEGLRYYLFPDFSKFSIGVVVAAIGQVFFSLSLGMGIILTYGSYLSKEENLEKDAIIIPSIDTLVALLAGFAILPAVFAFGLEPGQGPGLLFGTLPQVFASMPLGTLFAVMFFVLVLFAALTSSISLLETSVTFAIDRLNWSRSKAVAILSTLMFIIGIFASLSMGLLDGIVVPIINMNIFDALDWITSYVMLPIGGIMTSLFIGWIWNIDEAVEEVKIGSDQFKLEGLWRFLIRYFAPISISVVMISNLISFFGK